MCMCGGGLVCIRLYINHRFIWRCINSGAVNNPHTHVKTTHKHIIAQTYTYIHTYKHI